MKEAGSERRIYFFQCRSMDDLVLAWRIVAPVVCHGLRCTAEIDAYPSKDWDEFRDLPNYVQVGQSTLERWAQTRELPESNGNPLLAIKVDMRDEALRKAVYDFGPYSISAHIEDDEGNMILENFDGGSALIQLTEEGEFRLRRALDKKGLSFDEVLKNPAT